MRRFLLGAILLACAFGVTACFETVTSTIANLAPTPKAEADPLSAKLSQINSELANIESKIQQLQSDRVTAETQRNESFLELAKAMGTGPKPPAMMDFGSETLAADPGMLISMHNANVTAARERMKEIDAETAALNAKASQLKAERAQLEQAIAASQKSAFPGPGACFTPDTRILLPEGTRSIVAAAAGEEITAYDENSGELTRRPILQTFRGREDHYFLINAEVRVTAMHRFLTDRGWVRAKDLEPGVLLKTAEGWTPLLSKKLIEADVEVFNMEVAADHDFFVVGDRHAYLVHNTGGGGGGK
ncbi:MAG: polymorphic toxin-type HINT domain-containing protein [Desulfobacterales bacterium]